MKAPRAIAAVACATTSLICVPAAWASAEGPGTVQARAAHAEFLANWAPPSGKETAGVCVIDSGADTDTDLGATLVKRSAFDAGTLGDTGAMGDQGQPLAKHGTYVAGVIGSQMDGVGTNGIWPQAKVLSRRVFTAGSNTTAQRYINAITWCLSDPADNVKVINLSLSGLDGATIEQKSELENRIDSFREPPYSLNFVAAAGNNAVNYVGYPASAPGVFAVGATDANGAFASFSNRGTGLDISTFGTATCLTASSTVSPDTRLVTGEGTSYAAPVVSAVLAALRSGRPDLTPAQAEQLLLDNADIAAAGKVLNAAKVFEAAGLLTAEEAAKTYPAVPCALPPVGGGGGGAGAGGAGGGGGGGGGAKKAEPVPEPAAGQASAPAVAPTPVVNVELPTVDPFDELRPVKPTLQAFTYRRGVLSLRVDGFRRGERVVFRVSRRVTTRRGAKVRAQTYVRSRPVLKVRVKGWTKVTVQLQRPGIGASKRLTVRRNHEF